ncbi:MAG: alpha/beta hydrolase [Ruminococcaceae bacterium]|nr:alpha/beta hydrolase [Oscillospiraceae bacterium]
MAYTEKTGYFTSSDNRSEVYYKICIPEDMPKGIIQISHGMCEHIGRYTPLVEYFTDNGFVVCGNDHIGHGKSVKDDADLGYFGEGNYTCLADDLKKLNGIVRKTYRSLPYILIGHSMGSFVVRDYITRYADTIDSAVICGTSGTNKAAKSGIKLCKLIKLFKGERYRSVLVRNLTFKGYNSHFKDEKDDLSWLTSVKEIRDEYRADSKSGFAFTLDGYINMLTLLNKVSEEGWETKVPQSLPIFIISGFEDPVGNYGKGVKEIFERLDYCEINILKCKLYEESRHELFNETSRNEVMEDIYNFANEVIEGVLEARGYVRF